jgi:hypothetical protein
MTKVCTKCKVEKSLNEFHKSTRDGYRSQCKPCKKDSDKKWRKDNRGKDLEIKKKWRMENVEYSSKYYKDNKEKISQYNKMYYLNNTDDIISSSKKYYEGNKENCIEKSRDYYNSVKNSEEFRKRNNNYKKKAYRRTPYVFIQRNILKRHLKYINSEKIARTIDILGYTPLELKNHLESLFKEGMTWENYGEWHVDHIKPICKFDKTELSSTVNALENLQPLWAKDNLIKGDKYE